jgi:hypothetical protein
LWEQVEEGRAERHGVDHEVDLVGEFEPDDLQQVAGVVGSDRKDLGWVGVGFEVDEGEGMVEGVSNGSVGDSGLRADRWISTSKYRNT